MDYSPLPVIGTKGASNIDPLLPTSVTPTSQKFFYQNNDVYSTLTLDNKLNSPVVHYNASKEDNFISSNKAYAASLSEINSRANAPNTTHYHHGVRWSRRIVTKFEFHTSSASWKEADNGTPQYSISHTLLNNTTAATVSLMKNSNIPKYSITKGRGTKYETNNLDDETRAPSSIEIDITPQYSGFYPPVITHSTLSRNAINSSTEGLEYRRYNPFIGEFLAVDGRELGRVRRSLGHNRFSTAGSCV